MTRIRRSFETHWYAWAMVLPVVLVLAVLVGYPLGRGIYLSFTDANEANVARTIGVNHIPATYHFVGLDNYWKVLSGQEGHFYSRLTWTVVWTASCVLLHYALGLGLALLLNRKVRFRALYRVLLILPWAVPAFVATFSWRLIFNEKYGVLNAVLDRLGLGTVDWLGDTTLQKISAVAVNVWLGVPFMMVAILGGLQAIPGELHEAAEMDGASPWQRFRHVTLPGLRPVSGTVILLGTIWTFNMFQVIYLLVGQGASSDSEILVTYSYRLAFQGVRDYAGSATYGILILSLLLVFAVFYRRMLTRQETAR
ncbi:MULTISPECIES: carbohydrate ABC transporter permease [Streptomyces]|uniref:Sugar ABC transporter permease n=1 Tax=Streptomyces morookaense TaxID=1970 RepID=A0A7Y7E7Q0_STRMO|nr:MULTISPECIES: sugar ABC transporter permease [Streptomyces]MCC2277169.1 sugar ABC transporter permease [Streptomyces sp. ET3-23]NVK78497.1 sugar ABC transporter permease [Streptomyces morookaense]GHF32823.1 ABC transporter permease [Streptomyces morookaense]